MPKRITRARLHTAAVVLIAAALGLLVGWLNTGGIR